MQNINERQTNVVLGQREQVLYGPGFILDKLCGLSFRISSQSFYQVNSVQTEVLYRQAIELAGFTGAEHAIDADLYLYDNLFTLENVNDVPEGTDYLDYLNPDSLKKLTGCKLEPSLADAKEGERFQFVRMGYYCKDRESGRFNRIVTLKDSFAKTLKK